MNAAELKQKFVNFFVSQGHVEIPSSPIVPENDPTTLFISAGMHPLVPYLLGQSHPLGKRLVNVQKCIRTGDIDDIGDNRHHTFFEMLGNWSLGDYFKNDMIPWSFEFLTKILDIKPNNLHITCFVGDENSPKDEESASLWKTAGIPSNHIHFMPKEDNWWGPAGVTGPCGPDTEMFLDTKPELPEVEFEEGCRAERYVEIWNDVFMQFNKDSNGKYEPLKQTNVDTGMGVERTTAILSGFSDNYMSSIWQPIIKKIEEISNKIYVGSETKSMRIIADHIRASVFMIAAGIEPSNKERGYVLRRLIRRSIREGKKLGIESNFTVIIANAVLDNQNNFAGNYPELNLNKDRLLISLETEENKFRKTLDNGLKEIQKLIDKNKNVSGKEAFTLYESFGFPIEMVVEELKKNNLTLNIEEFNTAKEEHQQQSRTLSAGKFKSGLADNSEIATKYHTATHLLHAALRQVLGEHVQQSGSNITEERMRFDFSYPEKLTESQIKEIEDSVNAKINEKLPVICQTMKFTEAQKEGALAFFGAKYPKTVTVYTIGDIGNYFSKEVCTGPHISNTSELGQFKIIKEESASSGKRRIYAFFVVF